MWHKITDKLPPPNTEIITYAPTLGRQEFNFYVDYWQSAQAKSGRFTRNNSLVTHWMYPALNPEVD